ncbi:MAG: helix-turn-helix domain-containing protein [Deltaproteobacteria bacterium]|jgi:AraC-like DNA-binding protein
MPTVSAPVVASILPAAARRASVLPEHDPPAGARWSDAVAFDVWRFALARGAHPFEPSSRNTLDALGVYGFVVQTAPSGDEAVDAAARLFPLLSDRGAWRREEGVLRWCTPPPASDAVVASDASTIAHFAAGMIAVCGPAAVREVHVRWSSARGAERLGTSVFAGADEDRIVVGDTSAPPPRAHRPLFAHLLAEAEARLASLPASFVDGVARLIADGVRDPHDAARRLATSARTLRRRLEGSGTSFSTLLDQHRRQDARARVRRGEPIQHIADELGFSDPTAFARAYRRWYGRAPSGDRFQ